MSQAAQHSVTIPRHIVKARDLNDPAVLSRIYISPAYFGKNRNNKMCSIKPFENSRERLTIILDGCGTISSRFGVEASEYGKTYMQAPLLDEEEIAGLQALDRMLFERMSSDDCWPKRPVNSITGRRAPSAEMLAESYNRILKPRKMKNVENEADGYYPPSLKCTVPLKESGELKGGVRVINCRKENVSIHACPGQEIKRMVIEIHYVYFKDTTLFGIVKELKYVQIKGTGEGTDVSFFDNFGYLDDDEGAETAPAPDSEGATQDPDVAVKSAGKRPSPPVDDQELEELFGESSDGGTGRKRRHK